MSPYYDEDGITLYCGDCRDVLPVIGVPFESLVVVDPPYGIDHSSNHGATWAGNVIANDGDLALRDWILSVTAAQPAVVFGTWKKPRPANIRAVLIWDKGPAFGMGDLSFPWKNSFEEIYIIGGGFEGRRDEGVLRGHIVPSWESLGRRHQHEKPVSLIRHFINKHPFPVILDPCCGVGTSLRAAKDEGKKAIGIEIDERYCAIAVKRLAQGVLFGQEVA